MYHHKSYIKYTNRLHAIDRTCIINIYHSFYIHISYYIHSDTFCIFSVWNPIIWSHQSLGATSGDLS